MSESDTILVTGGAGYIGSHTCKVLKSKGYTPVTFDNLVYGHEYAVKWGPFEKGDILSEEQLSKVFEEYRPAAVIHFAAFAYVGESVTEPGKYYKNNVAGTINLLEVMRTFDCSKIVFSSTCATYGIPESVPISEVGAQNPVNPYGRSKLMIEHMLSDYDSAYGMKHVALRYFNAAGADPDGEIGEDHTPETHLIPLAIEAALGRREHLEVYGTDYNTSDGTAIRDYIHVTDLADAHLKALDMLQRENRSDQINLGTGSGTSVQDIIEGVGKCCKGVPVVYGPRRTGDPPLLIADAAKARDVLDWVPQHSELSTIVDTAVLWHQRLNR
jgi:UDP-glucose-4-epimerase GalE